MLEVKDPNEQTRLLHTATSSWSHKDPVAAAEFVEGLADPVIRDRNIVNVATNWLRKDREAADRWLQDAGISDDLKQRLLSQATN